MICNGPATAGSSGVALTLVGATTATIGGVASTNTFLSCTAPAASIFLTASNLIY